MTKETTPIKETAPIKMLGVREYAENYEVELCTDEDASRLVVRAYNEARCNCTSVDLRDLIAWIRVHRPDLLREEPTCLACEQGWHVKLIDGAPVHQHPSGLLVPCTKDTARKGADTVRDAASGATDIEGDA